MVFLLTAKACCPNYISSLVHGKLKSKHQHQRLEGMRLSQAEHHEPPFARRGFLNCVAACFVSTIGFNAGLSAFPVMAEEDQDKRKEEEEEGQGIVGAFKSLIDPNEKTKSGKVLPKAYLKSAREVVKTLRESLKEETKDITNFRRTADAAKESIREYLSNWRGQERVAREESYVELEKAIRSLATFYSKAGPSASLPEEVKSQILEDLTRAEEFL